MRLRDLIGLALFALSRHKLRSALTTLGVLFGTLVLVVSLSLLFGTQETILRQASRYAELRRVQVYPPPMESRPDDAPLVGKMSDARRERLLRERNRATLRRQELPAERRLTKQRIARFADIPHVVRVTPAVSRDAEVRFNGRAEPAQFLGIAPEFREGIERRLVLGELPAEGEDGIVLSEYLLYRLGLVDDEQVAKALGQPVTVEVQLGLDRPRPGLLLALFAGWNHRATRPEDEELLGKLLAGIPRSLDKLGLSGDEQKRLRAMLTDDKPGAKSQKIKISHRLRGVVRAASDDETRRFRGWMLGRSDVLLSNAAAEAIAQQVPYVRDNGYDEVAVEVDAMEHVKEVQSALKEQGFNAASALDFIEREQFVYLTVFTAMSVVAFIALLVAALGIINTMLMSVLERTREIGIMKAVGAREGHIQALFLMEGALIGAVGGAAGLGLAIALSYPADAWLQSLVAARMNIHLTGSLFSFPWWLVAGVPLFAVLVTTSAAWWPARRAVRIDPVQALRYE